MQISLKGLAIAFALLWGGLILAVGLANLEVPRYGSAFLHGTSSIYPGFRAAGTLSDVLLGTGYALLDGVLVGLLFGWLHNFFARS